MPNEVQEAILRREELVQLCYKHVEELEAWEKRRLVQERDSLFSGANLSTSTFLSKVPTRFSCVPVFPPRFDWLAVTHLVTFRPFVAPAGILVGGSSKGGGGGGGAGGLFGRSDHGGGVGGGGSYADPEHTELEDVGDYSDQMQELRDKNKEIVRCRWSAGRGPGRLAHTTGMGRNTGNRMLHWTPSAKASASCTRSPSTLAPSSTRKTR